MHASDPDMPLRTRQLIYGVKVLHSKQAAEELADLLDMPTDDLFTLLEGQKYMSAEVVEMLAPKEWASLWTDGSKEPRFLDVVWENLTREEVDEVFNRGKNHHD